MQTLMECIFSTFCRYCGVELSGTTKTSTTNKMTAGSWNHIAVCRASGTVYISVNGLTENFGSVTNSSTTSAFRIGEILKQLHFLKRAPF